MWRRIRGTGLLKTGPARSQSRSGFGACRARSRLIAPIATRRDVCRLMRLPGPSGWDSSPWPCETAADRSPGPAATPHRRLRWGAQRRGCVIRCVHISVGDRISRDSTDPRAVGRAMERDADRRWRTDFHRRWDRPGHPTLRPPEPFTIGSEAGDTGPTPMAVQRRGLASQRRRPPPALQRWFLRITTDG